MHFVAADVKPVIIDKTLCWLQCLWCEPLKVCTDYPVGKVLPPRSLCPLNDARWGVCWGESGQTSATKGCLQVLVVGFNESVQLSFISGMILL